MKNKETVHYVGIMSELIANKTTCGLNGHEFLMGTIFVKDVNCGNCKRTRQHKKHYKMYKAKQRKKRFIVYLIILIIVSMVALLFG